MTPFSAAARIPNDTYFDQLWQLQHVGITDAWDLSLGMETVPIAVIDSGVDLGGRRIIKKIWRNVDEVAGDGIDNDRNGYVDDAYGWDFVDNDNDPNPEIANGYTVVGANHGTVSAGLISAKGDNGRGIVGMTWQSPVMAIRALDSFGVGDPNKVARAVDYAVDNGAKVINLSFAGSTYSGRLADALRRAYDHGVFVVAAAGNAPENGDAINLDREFIYPICYDFGADENFIYGVAATDRSDMKADFSNYGAGCVDISAPGVHMLSTQLYIPDHQDFSAPYGGYYNGTSAAAPIVSGLVALIRSLDSRLTPKQVMNILTETSFNINPLNPEYFDRLGRGRIEAARALSRVSQKPEPPVKTVTSVSLLPDGYSGHLVIAAAGAGREPEVRMFTEDGLFVRSFNAYPAGFRGGVSLAVGNFDGDNRTSIVTGAGPGGGPQVRVFDINTRPVGGFFAYDPRFMGGVEVATCNLNADNQDEIVTGAGPGGGPHVRMFDKRGNSVGGFFAYAENYRGGIDVACGDLDGDGLAEIVTAAKDGSQHVKVFDSAGKFMVSFVPYPTRLKNMETEIRDLNGNGEAEVIVRGTSSYGKDISLLFDVNGKAIVDFGDDVPLVMLSLSAGEATEQARTEFFGGLPGAAPQVIVSSVRKTVLPAFYAFEPSFMGGLRSESVLFSKN
jgi:hypothetical protein